jgi:hypothetical protein
MAGDAPLLFLVVFEVLHGALVTLGSGHGTEGSQIAASAGAGVQFARVQPIFAG